MNPESSDEGSVLGLGKTQADLTPIESSLRKMAYISLAIVIVTRLIFAFIRIDIDQQGSLRDFFLVNGFDPLNASAFTALFVYFLISRPSYSLVKKAVFFGVILEILYQTVAVPSSYPLSQRPLLVGAGFGFAGVLFCLHKAVLGTHPNEKTRARFLMAVMALLIAYPLMAGIGIFIISSSTPLVSDLIGYNLEAYWGFYPTQEVAQFLLDHPFLRFWTSGTYSRLPLWISIGVALNVIYPERCYSNIFAAYLIGGILCIPCYLILPMVGISVLTGVESYPSVVLPFFDHVNLVPAPANFPRTCIPSMHISWALLPLLVAGRISRKTLAFFLAILTLTLLHTMDVGVGHYSIDLPLAIPYTVCILSLTARSFPQTKRLRVLTSLSCYLMVVGYLLLLRWNPEIVLTHAGLVWLILGGIVGISLYLERRLAAQTLKLMALSRKLTQ